MYYKGILIKQNYSKAADLYSKSCKADLSEGCYMLGLMYISGDGVTKNSLKGKELLKEACNAGNKKGCKFYKIFDKKI
jgi:TPR repeat protein